MACTFMDSFAHYPTADVLGKWTSQSAAVISNTGGPHSSGTSAYIELGGVTYVKKTVGAGLTGGWMAFRFRAAALPASGEYGSLAAFQDSAGAITHVGLSITPGGLIRAWRDRAGDGTILGTSSVAITAGTWHHIGVTVTIHDTTGSVKIYLDGILVLDLTNVDTRNGTPTTFDTYTLSYHSNGFGVSITTPRYADFACGDSAGSLNISAAEWGQKRIECRFPNGAGSNTGLSRGGTDSGANWSQVDETNQNGDTDYVHGSAAALKDTYAMENLVVTAGLVGAIQTVMVWRKDDAGARTATHVVRSGATDFDGASVGLATSYGYSLQVRETDPNTAVAWTISGVNAVEVGPKVVS